MNQTKRRLPLTETPTDGSVSNDYFYRMLSPQALRLSAPYHKEENAALDACFKAHPETKDMNFVGVGAGELWELRRALAHTKHYVCIEPLADIFINDSVRYLTEQSGNITILPKLFGDVSRDDFPPDPSFYMFLFNILSYIPEPITSINRLLQPGDILFLTTWAQTEAGRNTRASYFDFLNATETEVEIDPQDSIGLSHFDHFPFDELNHYRSSERIKGDITDILIIYT